MPDITLCTNRDCQLATHCYRFMAVPNLEYQSYSKFTPVMLGDRLTCSLFIELNKNQNEPKSSKTT
jgi:hypothetical protein